MELTNASIKTAQPGDVLHDQTVRGLHMRVFAESRSFWFFYRTKAGRQRRPKIGEYPTITLAMARDTARQWAGKVAAGGDPAEEWNDARSGLTVAAIVASYLERKTKTVDEARRCLEKDVLPRFGSRKAADVLPDEVVDLHASLTKRGKYIANRTLAYLSAAYNLAERKKRIPLGTNPCTAVDRNSEQKRRRFAKPGELAKLGPALEVVVKTRPRAVAFIYLLLYSGARPQEIEDARWDWLEVVEDCGVLRLPDGKTGARDVFLPPQAMAVIASLPRTSGTITGISKVTARDVWNEVRAQIGCPDLWMRDLRRTFGTAALSAGATTGAISELLGHSAIQTTTIYTKLMETAAHRTAASTAQQLENLIKSGAS